MRGGGGSEREGEGFRIEMGQGLLAYQRTFSLSLCEGLRLRYGRPGLRNRDVWLSWRLQFQRPVCPAPQ